MELWFPSTKNFKYGKTGENGCHLSDPTFIRVRDRMETFLLTLHSELFLLYLLDATGSLKPIYF